MTPEEKVIYILKSTLHQSTLPGDKTLMRIAKHIVAAVKDED